jgi:hypothetical protein
MLINLDSVSQPRFVTTSWYPTNQSAAEAERTHLKEHPIEGKQRDLFHARIVVRRGGGWLDAIRLVWFVQTSPLR